MALRRRQDPAGALRRRYRPISLAEIPMALRRAALIGEDVRFYQHHGIDYVEMRRALGYPRDSFSWRSSRDRAELWHAIERSITHPGRIRGASTITQQLAKNLYLSPSRNPLRKIKEAVTAWRLEFWLPKDRILELYLNTSEMGKEIWGADAASESYFHLPARRMDEEEAASLAALLPFPRSSNPNYHPGRMVWRRNLILARMGGRPVIVPPDTASAIPVEPSPDTQPDTIQTSSPPDTIALLRVLPARSANRNQPCIR
ncbi:MAG TPA: biosynthetic peptidoglycan transglycosylase [Gemmatimonadales bacterium]|jgi:monofunctional biosynthetic peptidoglycan transglycosylase